ncbi:MAG: fumarylacetoacetate hydrolase family protein [Anaerolineaceae bacterium]|nr:fumarylacetoacetate hydrolase family protein [Anaerolineaceae bacterium]MCB9098773.1 fumarylacetoacetate hydrolase family protein [Anaerolineales bacterium]
MKLITYINDQNENRIAYLEDNKVFPLDFEGDMIALIQNEPELLNTAIDQAVKKSSFSLEDINLTAPILNPAKIVAIGKNYAEHAIETKSAVPEEPIVFAKFATSIIGPGADITWNENLTSQVDFEAELAVIIGRRARNIVEEKAMEYVFGYTCANDVSARDLQYRGKQWVRGKSLDTFCPLGPWIVTADEIPNPQNLGIRCRVNGHTMQNSHTSKMIFSVSYLISFLSHHFTLLPGDIILTGTPDGVGAFREPPEFLRNGDSVTVEIDSIGQLNNRCHVTT